MWTPTHVFVNVIKARNLLEKSKGGNEAYCMIGMGKEKFITSVKGKTNSPVWDEQAEFELGEREDLKITIFHKASIIDEFIGRITISLADLINENSTSFQNWYKLGGKTSTLSSSDPSNKKHDKERGEIEVRINFFVRSAKGGSRVTAGSMLNLSQTKNKDTSMSLRNLKGNSLKNSFGDKFKISMKNVGKKPPKYNNGENQVKHFELLFIFFLNFKF
jgi:hypothetical protein